MSKWNIYDEGDIIMCNRYEAVRKHDSLHDFWQVRLLPDKPSEKAKVLFQTDDRNQVIKFFLDEYERNKSMSNYTSENTHILATHVQKDGNKRMLLFHIYESGRHEYVVGSYFTEELEYIEPNEQFPCGVTVDRQGDCCDEATRRYIGKANNFLSYQDADYYAAALESSREHGKTIHYTWDWGHYFSNVVDAVEYWNIVVHLDDGE